jgi:hypothetical protein
MSPSAREAKLYPQAPGSLFVAFYDSQGYGGVIPTRLHTGPIPKNKQCLIPLLGYFIQHTKDIIKCGYNYVSWWVCRQQKLLK